ncbi:hypothetical protein F2P56_025158 [Juglans regia]|uniref:HAT C-terminal dimerisation domain-containing protein n=1 Tax=Juglans regia TaxID=51240 RepID=A0A833UCR0_JUGRE|nr:hypothetical protein F2P56_025158 [Juglans regia]
MRRHRDTCLARVVSNKKQKILSIESKEDDGVVTIGNFTYDHKKRNTHISSSSSSTNILARTMPSGRSMFKSFVRGVDTFQPIKSDLDVYSEEGVYICKEESAFSAGGRVIDSYQASLATKTVQILLCGTDWVRARHGVKKELKDELESAEIVLP